ncbi:MAG: undecaprenyl-diphosphate phosphatase [Eubacteriales bacterium]|nr:undecaprenyl-diphosphate phosphatase [Eubacteriales bacterium]MDD4324471.1 undecaprenyl-diphosphate phosphatase [Eubacteriales bacterium]MDD4541303.1 undecaprenyl-diphosphate phosphatase [Eubacteriales bacterium]
MEWLELLKSIVYGIVQGISEWLPISSTGHLILLEKWLPLNVGASPAQASQFFSLFMTSLHLGSIMAVVVNFWPELWPFKRRETLVSSVQTIDESEYISLFSDAVLISRSQLRMWINILIAVIPAAIVGLLFQDDFERLFYNPFSVAVALIVVGIAFILVENYITGKNSKIKEMDQINLRIAFAIGLFQVIAAVFPGTSRSGITILGGLLIGLSRPLATKFTFYLAVPVMIGANVLKLFRYDAGVNSNQLIIIFVGMLTAFLVSIFVIRALLKYIRTNNFKPFAWYRIALGILVIVVNIL